MTRDYMPASVRELLDTKRAEARSDAAANRAAVLAYPDLAQKLTEPPLEYARPEQWNGFIPPAQFNQALNPSPRRRALMDITTEALTRHEQAGREVS